MCPVRVSVALACGWVVVGVAALRAERCVVGAPVRVAPEAWGPGREGVWRLPGATVRSSHGSRAATRPQLRPREVESTGSVLRVLRTASLQGVGCVFKTSGSARVGGADALGGAPESRLDRLPGLEKLSMSGTPYTHALCPAPGPGT